MFAEMQDRVTREIVKIWNHPLRRRYLVSMQVSVGIMVLSLLLYVATANDGSKQLAKRSWGGWDERPQTQQCYRQERTATLLALYLGVFGADHWYAHHWILASFKLLTLGGFGIWAIVDVTLWIVGGVYGTPGCPGGNKKSWLN